MLAIIFIAMFLIFFKILMYNAELAKLFGNMALLLVLSVLSFFVAGPGLVLIAVYIRGLK
jgi:hypothetical protein